MKYPELSHGTPQLDLFEDLRGRDVSEIKRELQDLYVALNSIEKVYQYEKAKGMMLSECQKR